MIYTLTLNPSLDHIIKLDKLVMGEINISTEEFFYPGGKGINVSRVLNNLGVENIPYGFIAGFVGEEIRKILEEEGIETEFIRVKNAINRVNVKMKADVETEINSKGPVITAADKAKLLEKIFDLKDGDYLVLAGSIPKSTKEDIYKEIMGVLKDNNVNFIVDSRGKTLLDTLVYKPLLVKPNKKELEEIANRSLANREEILIEARKLKEAGAKNVIVSLGADGAVFLDEEGNEYYQMAPEGKLINSVGSGDSMVAGFIKGRMEGLSSKEILKLAVACGSATAFNEDLAKKEDIETVLKSME